MKLGKFIDKLEQLEHKYGSELPVYILIDEEGGAVDLDLSVAQDEKGKPFLVVMWK